MTFTPAQIEDAVDENFYGLLTYHYEAKVLDQFALKVSFDEHLKDYGEDSLRVLIFRIGDQYFKKTGYYSSWDNGNEFENWDGELVEVRRVEKIIPARTVIEWEEV